MDKHVVIMDGDKDRSPFDIQDQRAIKYGLMPDEIEAAVAQLQAKATNGNAASAFKDMMNPVATAFRTWTTQQRVETSGDTTEQMLLRVVERLEKKVDRVGRQSEVEGLSWSVNVTDAESGDLRSRAERAVAQIEKGVNQGRLHPSLSGVAKAARDVIQSVEDGGSVKGLRRFLADFDYIMRRSQDGEPVKAADLPSQRPLYAGDEVLTP